jgi:hypothetical protein
MTATFNQLFRLNYVILKFALIFMLWWQFTKAEHCEEGDEECGEPKPTRYEIIEVEWKEVKLPLNIILWLFVSAVAKIR